MDDNEYSREIANAKSDLSKLRKRFNELYPDWDELAQRPTKKDGPRLLMAAAMMLTVRELEEAIKEAGAEYQQMNKDFWK